MLSSSCDGAFTTGSVLESDREGQSPMKCAEKVAPASEQLSALNQSALAERTSRSAAMLRQRSGPTSKTGALIKGPPSRFTDPSLPGTNSRGCNRAGSGNPEGDLFFTAQVRSLGPWPSA